MSTYYEYRDVGVMIAHKLMAMDGWEVFGYHADHSDMMTDYYDPAYWNGIATKNGYILVVNCSSEAKPEEIRKYNYDGTLQDRSISEKIAKLEQMTIQVTMDLYVHVTDEQLSDEIEKMNKAI